MAKAATAFILIVREMMTKFDREEKMCIRDRGYKDMYPSVRFAGTFTAYNIIKNENPRNKGAAAFFSGGVDAFHTLVEHLEEKPVLLTVWGADIKFEDETGWQKVFHHLEKTAEEFQLDYVTIKSSFRLFINCLLYTSQGEWLSFYMRNKGQK